MQRRLTACASFPCVSKPFSEVRCELTLYPLAPVLLRLIRCVSDVSASALATILALSSRSKKLMTSKTRGESDRTTSDTGRSPGTRTWGRWKTSPTYRGAKMKTRPAETA